MVVWSARARSDLKAIHDYIAEDSPKSAKKVMGDILSKVHVLVELPMLGKVVAEVNDAQLREISAHSWRILYRIHNAKISVVTVIHKRRQLGGSDLT